MNFLCILLFFKFSCILLFYDLWSISSWITKQKEDKITDLQAKMKNSLCHLFCPQNEKILTFWVDLWSQKVAWLRNGRSDFRKLGVKISARLQRKKSCSGAAESAAVLRVRQNLSRGASEAPPPSSAVRVKSWAFIVHALLPGTSKLLTLSYFLRGHAFTSLCRALKELLRLHTHKHTHTHIDFHKKHTYCSL